MEYGLQNKTVSFLMSVREYNESDIIMNDNEIKRYLVCHVDVPIPSISWQMSRGFRVMFSALSYICHIPFVN